MDLRFSQGDADTIGSRYKIDAGRHAFLVPIGEEQEDGSFAFSTVQGDTVYGFERSVISDMMRLLRSVGTYCILGEGYVVLATIEGSDDASVFEEWLKIHEYPFDRIL